MAVRRDAEAGVSVTTSTQNRQMASSAMWAGVSSAGNQILSFVVFVVVARLVTPQEFGIVALAVLLLDLSLILSVAGLVDAVIQRPELDEEAADTAFWANLGLGALFGLLALLLAAPVAALFATPELEHVVNLLAISFIITGAGTIHTARLMRNFGFRALALRNLVTGLLSGAVGIGVALGGGGADALIAQRLVAAACTTIIGWWALRWVPRLRFSPRAFRELMRYGARTTGAQLVLQLNTRLLELIAGLFIGPVAVGILRIAHRATDTLTQLTIMPFQQTALPVLARAQGDRASSQAAYLGLSRLSAFIVLPAFAGTFSIAPIAVSFVFGAQWAEAGPLMQLVCLFVVSLLFSTLLPPAVGAAGHPGDMLIWSVVQLLLGLVLLTIGAQFGLYGLIAFNLLRAYLVLPLGFYLLRRRTGIGARMFFGNIARSLALALAMAAMVELARWLLLPVLPVWAVLLACVLVGVTAYAGLSFLFNRRMLREAVSLLPGRLRARLGQA